MIILDLREKQYYDQSHLRGAVNVPTPPPPLTGDEIEMLYHNLLYTLYQHNIQYDDYIGIYCKKGIRAGIASQLLLNYGFTNVENLGGFSKLK